MTRVAFAMLIALLSVVTPAVTRAQASCSVTGTAGKCSPDISLSTPATMTNPLLAQFTVSPSSTLSATATVADMDVVDGMTTGSVATITVLANRSWTISVKANSALWTASSGAWASKPASDLHWSLTPSGASTALSTTASTLLTGAAGAGAATNVYFRPVVHFLTDKPGVYTMGVTFTVTAP